MGPKGAGLIHWKLVLQKRVKGGAAYLFNEFSTLFSEVEEKFYDRGNARFSSGKEFLSHSCEY